MNGSLLKHDFENIFEMYNYKTLDTIFFGESDIEKANKILSGLELKNDKMRLGFEIPLSGKPRFDLIGYCKTKYCQPDNFVHGYPKGSDSIISFAYNKNLPTDTFIEYDITKGNCIPGVYIIPRDYGNIGCFDEILHQQSQDKYIEPVFKLFGNHPTKWTPYYCIYFDNRGVDNVRISFIIDAKKYTDNSSCFFKDLQSVGYKYISDIMIKQINQIIQNSILLEVMFDMYEDGSFGPILGFSTFLNEYKFAPWISSFLLENKLADDRSILLNDLSFYNFEEIEYEGRIRTRLYGTKFNSIKFRYSSGEPIPAKIYLCSLGKFVD